MDSAAGRSMHPSIHEGVYPPKKRRKHNRGDAPTSQRDNEAQIEIPSQSQARRGEVDEGAKLYTEADNWSDYGTESIATLDSADLAARRPNRWRGPARVWRVVTEVDRAVVTAMQRKRDDDLAAHLFNAFCLKQVNDSVVGPPAWRPRYNWTAWPLRLRDNPSVFEKTASRYMKDRRHLGGHRVAMAQNRKRRPVRSRTGELDGPSGPLAEMLTATILRLSRTQFQHRQQSLTTTATSEQSAPKNKKDSPPFPGPSSKTPLPLPQEGRPAVISADDELSERILSPIVRHLLTKVDKVLLLLHNARAATAIVKDGSLRHDARRLQRRHVARHAQRTLLGRFPRPSKVKTWTWPDEWEPETAILSKTGAKTMTTNRAKMLTEALTTPLTETIPDLPRLEDTTLVVTHTPKSATTRDKQAPQVEPSDTGAACSHYRSVGRPLNSSERLPKETDIQFQTRRAREKHRRIPDLSNDGTKDPTTALWATVIQQHAALRTKAEQLPGGGSEREAGDVEEERVEKERVEDEPDFDQAPPRTRRQRRVSFVKDTEISKQSDEEREADSDPRSDSESNPISQSRSQPEAELVSAPNLHDIPSSERQKQLQDGAGTKRLSGKNIARWALRDWTDVVGAAALSGGFDQQVLARTAQRCADLFGQSMVLDTVPGRSNASGADEKKRVKVSHVLYAPRTGSQRFAAATADVARQLADEARHAAVVEVQHALEQRQERLARRFRVMGSELPTATGGGIGQAQDEQEDDDSASEGDERRGETGESQYDSEEEIDADNGRNVKAVKARAYPEPMATETAAESVDKQRQSPSPSLAVSSGTPGTKIHNQPLSKTTAKDTAWFCPRPRCPRALEGFTRRTNMVRHLKLMHGVTLGAGDAKPDELLQPIRLHGAQRRLGAGEKTSKDVYSSRQQ